MRQSINQSKLIGHKDHSKQCACTRVQKFHASPSKNFCQTRRALEDVEKWSFLVHVIDDFINGFFILNQIKILPVPLWVVVVVTLYFISCFFTYNDSLIDCSAI